MPFVTNFVSDRLTQVIRRKSIVDALDCLVSGGQGQSKIWMVMQPRWSCQFAARLSGARKTFHQWAAKTVNGISGGGTPASATQRPYVVVPCVVESGTFAIASEQEGGPVDLAAKTILA